MEVSNINGYDIKDKKSIRTYDTVALMKADSTLKEGQHVKITTPNIDIVIFDDVDLVSTFKKGKNYTMNAVGEISWNDWEEQPKLQLIVSGYEIEEKPDTGWSIYDF